MATIGDDIKNDVIQALGTAVTILRDGGNITGEKCLYEINRQVTKPFIREFFLETQFAYDTQAVSGDIVQFDDARIFIMVNKTPEQFENVAIEQQCVLYKCNVAGELLRPSGEAWDTQTYHKVQSWETIKSDTSALLTEALFGNELDDDAELGNIGLTRNELYIPHSVGTRIGDRFQPVSGESEYYMVEVIKTRKHPGVDVCELAEDTR